MEYKKEHRKHVINQYLKLIGEDLLVIDDKFIELKKYLAEILPKDKFKITSNTYNHILFYGKSETDLSIQYDHFRRILWIDRYIAEELYYLMTGEKTILISTKINQLFYIDLFSQFYNLNIEKLCTKYYANTMRDFRFEKI